MPTVQLDNKSFAAEAGETILEVARRNGVWIPTLCHHPAVEPYAACRLCMVEVNRGDWWQMVTACNYPIRRDLEVRIESDRAQAARRGVMHLLLARAPESGALRHLAACMDVEPAELPKVSEAERNCILCGLCVQVCEEQIGAAAIAMSGRGVCRKVSTPFGEPADACILCGACEAVCPVGTIELIVRGDEMELVPFGIKAPVPGCAECGAPVAADTLRQALRRRASRAFRTALSNEAVCPRCQRTKLAMIISAVAPSAGSLNHSPSS